MITAYWNNLSFSIKTFTLVFLLLSFTVITGFRYHLLIIDLSQNSAKHTSDIMFNGYKKELKDMVDVMAHTLASATASETDEKEIHTLFSELIQSARFFPDRSGYYFIYRAGGEVFVHATQPDLEGENLSHLVDPNGKYFIKELDSVSRAGGGYVEYWWEKPGLGLYPKLSYARMIPDSEFWIGTGVYIDDIEDHKKEILREISTHTKKFMHSLYLVLAGSCLLVVLPLTLLLIRSIILPIQALTDLADNYSLGQIDEEIPYTDRKDEIGRMAKALDRLGASIKVAMHRLAKNNR